MRKLSFKHTSHALIGALLIFSTGAAPTRPNILGALSSHVQAAGSIQVSEAQLLKAAESGLKQVNEFRFIRDLAKEMGVRVWLFGGTASSFAHYVHWDLMRLSGDTRFQADRFTYDYTDIFRSTQDLDIVVDGTLAQVDLFQKKLAEEYPHFLGAKAKWEVRSLRHSRGQPGEIGYKEALLNDSDFINQNTDSNSLGMVEVTESQNPVVTDLKEMGGEPQSQFLTDILSQRITYYRSSKHHLTGRFKTGSNPEIFSVLRALTKAFQYDLKLSEQDEKEMRAIIDRFDVRSISTIEAQRRFKEIGIKLIKHAVNIEYAIETLERLKLRNKLLDFDNINEIDSLAYWINKEALKTRPLGRPTGPTALEVFRSEGWPMPNGELIVTHETNSFLAYESITRAHTGEPNVVISRLGVTGENAAFGNGFYTRIGLEGARGTRLPIRFKLNPEATLCRSERDDDCDFWINGDYIVIKNKKAIRVIPEAIKLTLVQYLEILKSGQDFRDNLALREKFERRIQHSAKNLSGSELNDLSKIIEQAVKSPLDSNHLLVLIKWEQLRWPHKPSLYSSRELAQALAKSLKRLSVARHNEVLVKNVIELLSILPFSADFREVYDVMIERRDHLGPNFLEWIVINKAGAYQKEYLAQLTISVPTFLNLMTWNPNSPAAEYIKTRLSSQLPKLTSNELKEAQDEFKRIFRGDLRTSEVVAVGKWFEVKGSQSINAFSTADLVRYLEDILRESFDHTSGYTVVEILGQLPFAPEYKHLYDQLINKPDKSGQLFLELLVREPYGKEKRTYLVNLTEQRGPPLARFNEVLKDLATNDSTTHLFLALLNSKPKYGPSMEELLTKSLGVHSRSWLSFQQALSLYRKGAQSDDLRTCRDNF